MSNSLQPHELQHTRLPLSFTISRSSLKFMSFSVSDAISSSAISSPFRPQFFPASGSFPMSHLFASDGQSIGASASAHPMNIQDWFPLGWTALNSLQSKGLSKVFSSTQFKIIYSSALSLLYDPTLMSVRDYWKGHSFDYLELCQQSDVFAFLGSQWNLAGKPSIINPWSKPVPS